MMKNGACGSSWWSTTSNAKRGVSFIQTMCMLTASRTEFCCSSTHRNVECNLQWFLQWNVCVLEYYLFILQRFFSVFIFRRIRRSFQFVFIFQWRLRFQFGFVIQLPRRFQFVFIFQRRRRLQFGFIFQRRRRFQFGFIFRRQRTFQNGRN